MTATNVYGELASQKKRLLDKILENEDLAGVVMGLLGRLCVVAVGKGLPVSAIELDPLDAQDNVFKARVHFHSIPTARPLIWTPKPGDFQAYVQMRAGVLAEALGQNRNLQNFFEDLVSRILQYAEHKGIPFAALRFTKHVITRDDLIWLEVGRWTDELLRAG